MKVCWSFYNLLYLWNPSIRKIKKLANAHFYFPYSCSCVAHGLAYHSQNNDFKILRIGQVNKLWAKAEVYTLSMDSWRELVMPVESLTRSRSIGTQESFCLFLNGALHTRVDCAEGRFILSFDVNDERFRKIMLPQNYLVGVSVIFEQLAVILGLLTFFSVTMWMKLLVYVTYG